MKIEIYLNGLDINEFQAKELAEDLDEYFQKRFGRELKIIVQPSCWLYERKKRKKKK